MTQHIAIQAHDENFNYTVILERTPELEAQIRRRMELAAEVAEKDSECTALVFGFYHFKVYEDLDLGDTFDNDNVALVDELPELGEPARVDYGALVIDAEDLYLRFGIKYADLSETPMFGRVLFPKETR